MPAQGLHAGHCPWRHCGHCPNWSGHIAALEAPHHHTRSSRIRALREGAHERQVGHGKHIEFISTIANIIIIIDIAGRESYIQTGHIHLQESHLCGQIIRNVCPLLSLVKFAI